MDDLECMLDVDIVCLPTLCGAFGPCFRLGDARPESPVERIDMYM